MKTLLAILFLFLATCASAQRVDSIYFHLYTDSLKRGFYNYINVDGRRSDGSWLPLDSNDIILTSDAGHFRGNDLFIDKSWTGNAVHVKAVLRRDPAIWREITIYIRKRGFNEKLKRADELIF